jgi:hypothetical protein
MAEHREQKVEAIARRLYKELMGEDYEDYSWEPGEGSPSNETEREARKFALWAMEALEEFEGKIPQDRPPLPKSVYDILSPLLTPGGCDLWWTNYLRLDPHAQEGHAREHARRFAYSLRDGHRIFSV